MLNSKTHPSPIFSIFSLIGTLMIDSLLPTILTGAQIVEVLKDTIMEVQFFTLNVVAYNEK